MGEDRWASWAPTDPQEVARWVSTWRRNWRDHVDRMGQDRWASWAKHQKPSTNRPPGRPPKRWRESCTSTSEEDWYTQRYWVFGLCPSFGFFLNNNGKTQRFGNLISFRPQVREDTYSVGSLRKS
jgi:hypothetical protein